MGDAWEWDLADDVTISARVTLPERIESVWLGKRLVSRSGAGGKGADHIVALPPPKTAPQASDVYRASAPPTQAELTFDPVGTLCTLRVDGKIVKPTREPDNAVDALSPESARALAAAAAAPRRYLGLERKHWGLIGAIGFSLLAVGFGPSVIRRMQTNSLRAKIADEPADTELTATVRAADYSIAAHYPADFEPTVDDQGAVISLHRVKKLEMIVLMSMPRPDLDDPKDLDRIMMKELTAFTTKTGATMSTTITRDDTCKGFPGVVSTAILSKPDSREDVSLKVVACSTLREGRGYFFAYFVPEFLADREEPAMKAIVDATDIFEVPEPVANEHERADDRANADPGRVIFSAQGSTTGFGTPPPNFQPRRVYPNGGGETWPAGGQAGGQRPPPRPRPIAVRPTSLPPAPTGPALQFNPNGSVEFAGKTQDAERERKMRANRQRVPW